MGTRIGYEKLTEKKLQSSDFNIIAAIAEIIKNVVSKVKFENVEKSFQTRPITKLNRRTLERSLVHVMFCDLVRLV